MLSPKEGRDLRKSYKRLIWFIVGVFALDAFICFLLFSYTKLSPVVCGIIIIAITGVLYLLFLLICAKIDNRRKRKLENSKKKDPFSHS